MRLFYRGLKFIMRDVLIGLEMTEAQVSPVVDHFPCFLRTAELVQLQNGTSGSLQVRTGQVDLRSRHLTFVDHRLDVLIQIRLHAAAGACRRDTKRKIEPRKGYAHRGIERRIAAGRIEEMFMHADQSGNDSIAAQVENLGTAWDGNVGPDCANPFISDDDSLVFCRRRATSIDHANMRQYHHRRVNSHEFMHRCRQG